MKQFELTPKDSYGYQRIIKGGKILPNVFVSNNVEPNTMLIIDHDAEMNLEEVKFKPFRSGIIKTLEDDKDE
jgi:hypothetical protein